MHCSETGFVLWGVPGDGVYLSPPLSLGVPPVLKLSWVPHIHTLPRRWGHITPRQGLVPPPWWHCFSFMQCRASSCSPNAAIPSCLTHRCALFEMLPLLQGEDAAWQVRCLPALTCCSTNSTRACPPCLHLPTSTPGDGPGSSLLYHAVTASSGCSSALLNHY